MILSGTKKALIFFGYLAVGFIIFQSPLFEFPANFSADNLKPQLAFQPISTVSSQKLKETVSAAGIFGRNENINIKKLTNNNNTIKLIGIVYEGDKSNKSRVILKLDNQELSYQLGQQVPGVGYIKSVDKKSVIFETQNGLEQLELFKE